MFNNCIPNKVNTRHTFVDYTINTKNMSDEEIQEQLDTMNKYFKSLEEDDEDCDTIGTHTRW